MSCANVGYKIVLALDWRSRQTARDGDLSNVRERVGYGSLKKLFHWRMQRLVGSQIGVECSECHVEALHILLPGLWLGIAPLLLALGNRQAPVEQIADMSQKLARRASARTAVK